MATIFPLSPTIGQQYSGYEWNGTAWIVIGIDLTEDYATKDELNSHELDTTNIHGISNSANIIFDNDSRILIFCTSSTRPLEPSEGQIIYETDTNLYYGWNGSSWTGIGGGAAGGGTDQVFYENGQTVTTNYTITSSKNAVSAGPITINSGVTVTIPSGSVWSIV